MDTLGQKRKRAARLVSRSTAGPSERLHTMRPSEAYGMIIRAARESTNHLGRRTVSAEHCVFRVLAAMHRRAETLRLTLTRHLAAYKARAEPLPVVSVLALHPAVWWSGNILYRQVGAFIHHPMVAEFPPEFIENFLYTYRWESRTKVVLRLINEIWHYYVKQKLATPLCAPPPLDALFPGISVWEDVSDS
jgi:hypothetical protein